MFKKHWIIIAIVCLATWLRTWQLNDRAIFFGDAAHDLLVAAQSVEQRQLPLLGIASSVPRFKQGPLTVWLEMLLFVLAGHQLLVYSLVFAAISLAAVIGVYEFAVLKLSKPVAYAAAALVATSPLGVAHGRVVYHITPIPLLLVLYLFSLMYLSEKKPRSLFWAVLAWCGLFQFELALAPLAVLIPWVLWRTRQKVSQAWIKPVGLGLLIGLLPQLTFDVTNRFAQLGGFTVWVGYRIASALGLVGGHALGWGRLQMAVEQFWLYAGRVVSTDQVWLKGLMLGLLLVAGVKSWQLLRRKKLPLAMELCWAALGLLSLGFVIHGAPSEAYFPPFIVLLPLIIAFGVFQLSGRFQMAAVGMLCLVMLINTVNIVRHQFFVSNPQAFNYGASLAEQREVVRYINQQSRSQFQFATTQAGGKFPSFFDNLRWVAAEQGLAETKPQGSGFFVEAKDSSLQTYPGMKKTVFTTWDVYQVPVFTR